MTKDAMLLHSSFPILGAGFIFLFSSLFGEDAQFDYIIFFRWVGSTTKWELNDESSHFFGGGKDLL